MEMEYDFNLLMGYLENRDYRSLRAALAEENEVDIADFIERLPQERRPSPSARCPRSWRRRFFPTCRPRPGR